MDERSPESAGIQTRCPGTPDIQVPEIRSLSRCTLRSSANDCLTLALVNDFSHLIRVSSRDSRALEKLLAFPSVHAVQFSVQPYPGKFPITPRRSMCNLEHFCYLVVVQSAKKFKLDHSGFS